VREVKEVYEGEVLALKVEETESLHGDYVKAVSHVEITLKSAKGTKKLRLDPNVYEGLQKERVAVGDVIYVEANSGAVKRVGRCDAFATEFDLEAEEYVPLPKGDVHKKREVVQDVTMHDLDAANATPQGGQDMLSLMGQMGVPRRTEITAKLRSKVNELVNKYVEQGIAEVVPGVLFIDEVHMLDVKCFSFLSRAIESPLAPILVFATNRGVCQVIGAADGVLSPHGIPSDMLDRVMIVTTKPYAAEELSQIVEQRVRAEGVATDGSGIAALAALASERASLRYAIALIGPSAVIAKAAGREQVTADDVKRASQLFHSVRA
jgi:RuvB-like protein 1 (pontin 52)